MKEKEKRYMKWYTEGEGERYTDNNGMRYKRDKHVSILGSRGINTPVSMKDLRNLVAYYTNKPVLIEYNDKSEIPFLHLYLTIPYRQAHSFPTPVTGIDILTDIYSRDSAIIAPSLPPGLQLFTQLWNLA
jgi:hypothetical protein